MNYRLYGDFHSGAAVVELALAEIGVDYEWIEISLRDNAQRSADFARLNPQKKVPALMVDDTMLLTESVAILLYLDARHEGAKLMPPRGSQDWATAMRWLLFVATEIYPIVEISDYPERFTPTPETSVEATREMARGIWRDRWLLVENAIAAGPYLLGPTPTLADWYIAVVSRWAQQDAWRPEFVPKVERLSQSIASRENSAPVWKRHFGS